MSLLLLLLLAMASGGPCDRSQAVAPRQLLQAPCSGSASPVQDLTAGSTYTAQMSGGNNARGTFSMAVDEGGQRASWSLSLCDVKGYVSSHLHTVSSSNNIMPYLHALKSYDLLLTRQLPWECFAIS